MTTPSQESFQVQLQSYQGPIDLLLYLVKRSEVEIDQIPVNRIAEQYMEFLDVVKEIDINLVGDFLEVASLLVEAKLRAILPNTEAGDEESGHDDPREDLVNRLLLYKEFKDVAVMLEEQSRQWQQRYPRQVDDLPPRKIDVAAQPIEEVELWDLVSAFGRVLRNSKAREATNIVYDDTPVHVYMQRIHDKLVNDQQMRFSEFFEPGMHKSAMVGVFLAILELVRHHSVKTEQMEGLADILVSQGAEFSKDTKIHATDY